MREPRPRQAEQSVRRHRTDTIAEGIGLDRLTANLALGLPEHNGGRPGVDLAVRASDQEALEMAHYLLAHEGVFVGSSAAVNCVGAVKAGLLGSSSSRCLCLGFFLLAGPLSIRPIRFEIDLGQIRFELDLAARRCGPTLAESSCTSWRRGSDAILTPCSCSPIRRAFRSDQLCRFDAD
ncbi:unnamed protein product [Prorocentrum cordatum]|uniref:Subtilisin n=1 Tax=Prorocentrum cordatum TaxID=2364126 RepID=A0ABN9Y092_9DINO|nr:unnamed protein product [Polarella glacialis]